MSFLNDILASALDLETPQGFWYWGGLATISAVVKDNIWLPRGGTYYNLYPNIYVMFHAESGLKKGPPINLAKDLVKRVNNTRIISGRSSIQGILKDLGTAYSQPGGKVVTKSVAFIVSSELSSSIVEDKAAATILTDLYDRNYNEGDWRSLLKMEVFTLKDPTITMLTATNEAHSEDFFSRRDIQGGYFARTFIIYETEENAINSLIFPLNKPFNRDELVSYLKQLSALSGPFKPLGALEPSEEYNIEVNENNQIRYTNKPGKIYNDWYMNFKASVKKYAIKDPTGTLNRFGDSVLKVAMLLALSEKPELEIRESNIIEAIDHCERLIGAARKTTLGKEGRSEWAAAKAMVINELVERSNHMITRTQLLKKFLMHFDADNWDDIIFPSLNGAGIITLETDANVILYVMPEAQVNEWKKHFGGK